MKKVLILNHNQENFGTYYRCFFIAKYLSRNGYNVKMICASGKSFELGIKKRKIDGNFTLITLPRIKYHTYFTGQLILRLPLAVLYALFSDYDICHAFTVAQPQIGIPAWVAKKIRRKKLVVDWDDMWGGGFAEEHGGIVSRVLGSCERYFIKFADKITYVSEMIGRQIDKLNLSIEKIKIPNGCNVDQIKALDKTECRTKLKLNERNKYLVSVGNTYTESLGIMLKAFEKLSENFDNIFLIMVGEGKITPGFRSLYSKLRKKVIRTGKRPFQEIPIFLSAADALVLPMEDNNIEKARFPMRFGDYLCSGRPIVSNAVGEVKYYMEKYGCGYVSPPEDSEKMSDNMKKAIEQDSLSLRKKSLDLASGELAWGNVINKLIQVYENI